MTCGNPNCDGEWVTEPPLQDGGMCAVRQCPDCAAAARREAARREADNPFSYPPGQEPPRPQHKVRGVCALCLGAAYVQHPTDNKRWVCWPCAYHLAN